MHKTKIHVFEQIVRFEDVDVSGLVYHPIFLNYLERARSQSLIDQGMSFKNIMAEGVGMVVSSVNMKYIKPLKLEEVFFVGSQIDRFQDCIIDVTQVITRSSHDLLVDNLKENLRSINNLCFYAQIKLCIISLSTGRPVTAPEWLRALGQGV